jgi:hypothetical protein
MMHSPSRPVPFIRSIEYFRTYIVAIFAGPGGVRHREMPNNLFGHHADLRSECTDKSAPAQRYPRPEGGVGGPAQ